MSESCTSHLKEISISSFTEELIDIWRDKKDDEEYYKKFSTLQKEELLELIDYLIEEIEEIKGVNKLIRLKESLSAVFDLKLLYNNLKNTVVSSY
ncbi:hypothetical protein [Mycoplasma parvum]|uniref:hypothetical protein n=1 Tax=Mycoplasma parvum TaxID=984991 RepID=UPI001F33FA0A|nr:hypothetical protein [Mycoplasma parvum]